MNYSKGDVVLLPYPFTDLTTTKVRPAVVLSANKGKFNDLFASKKGRGDFVHGFKLSAWFHKALA